MINTGKPFSVVLLNLDVRILEFRLMATMWPHAPPSAIEQSIKTRRWALHILKFKIKVKEDKFWKF